MPSPMAQLAGGPYLSHEHLQALAGASAIPQPNAGFDMSMLANLSPQQHQQLALGMQPDAQGQQFSGLQIPLPHPPADAAQPSHPGVPPPNADDGGASAGAHTQHDAALSAVPQPGGVQVPAPEAVAGGDNSAAMLAALQQQQGLLPLLAGGLASGLNVPAHNGLPAPVGAPEAPPAIPQPVKSEYDQTALAQLPNAMPTHAGAGGYEPHTEQQHLSNGPANALHVPPPFEAEAAHAPSTHDQQPVDGMHAAHYGQPESHWVAPDAAAAGGGNEGIPYGHGIGDQQVHADG